MKKEKTKFIKKVVYMLISIFSILFIIIASVNGAIKDNKKVKNISINKGWTIEIDDATEKNIDILKYDCSKIDDNEVILSYTMKKDYNIVFPTIFLKTDNDILDIYFNDEKIDMKYDNNKEVNMEYYEINLPTNYKGKVLKIHIKLNGSKEINLVNSLDFMSDKDYVLYTLRSNIVQCLMSIAMCILGLLIILIVLVVPTKTQRLKKLFWTGFTFLCGSVAMMAYYEFFELLFNNKGLVKNMIFTGLFLTIPSVLMIAYNTFRNKKYKKIMFGYNIILYVVYVAMMVLNKCNVVTYDKVMLSMEVIMVITAILLLIYNILSYVKVNIMEKIYTIGMSCCYIICILLVGNCIINRLLVESFNANVGVVAIVFCFFITTIIYYAYVVDGYLNKVTEKRILSTLAYTDPLTGMMNRTKYEEIIEELENKDKDNIVIYSFDLNNLKKVNDTYGHEMGDNYIKNFANSLTEIYEDTDYVGRIGGDEFAVIVENRINDIDNSISRLKDCFSKYMKECNVEYEASFAYGCADNQIEQLSIKDLIKLADDRMYEYKKQQKIARE